MKALLFALAVSSLAGGALADAHTDFVKPYPNRTLGPAPVAACAKFATQTVAPDGVPFYRRLDRLPWGVLEHAVLRTVGGCPVREIVMGGETYYLAAGTPQIERLDPAAPKSLEKHFGF